MSKNSWMQFHWTPNTYPSLNDKRQIKLNKISEIKDYFVAEIKEIELISKMLSKYIAYFDYYDESLIVLSATSGAISIASSATVDHLKQVPALVLHFQFL